MEIVDVARAFIRQPFPLWENTLTNMLVALAIPEQASLSLPLSERWKLDVNGESKQILLDVPAFDLLSPFYDEHGLTPIPPADLIASSAVIKLDAALQVLGKIQPVSICIDTLVRGIQVIGSDDDEIDVSFSHPDLPATIFVSVCSDMSEVSNLRVAESILHEVMHLKLTLIEHVVPLAKSDADNLYFSPWRDEKRPACGVLHGLFVFTAILDFFHKSCALSTEAADHINFRKETIEAEIGSLKHFYLCPDLTPDGATLVRSLLPLS
jgi:HEXXH motif-containing protein